MIGRSVVFAVLLQGLLMAQSLTTPLAPGDTFSVSHTPMNAKLVPLDCNAKKIPIHSFKRAGNEATFLIPQDSPTCTYELLGTQIKVVRPSGVKNPAATKPPDKTLPQSSK